MAQIDTILMNVVGTTPGNSMAQVQINRTGTIKYVQMLCQSAIETDCIFNAQLAVNRTTYNANSSAASSGVLCIGGADCLLTTSGISNSSTMSAMPMSYRVSERDVLYINATGSGTSGANIQCLIAIES